MYIIHHTLSATGPYIGHVATTDAGSSGSPVLREFHGQWIVVGLHCGTLAMGEKKVNYATLITAIVDHMRGKSYTEECKQTTMHGYTCISVQPLASCTVIATLRIWDVSATIV